MKVELHSFISYYLNNHLVISTATYSEGIYTADMCTLKVGIVGDKDEQTGEHILPDPNTMPTTEAKGYVICQPLKTVFYHISKH